ncbi:hypothetical protein Tco_0930208 [Tanacetum coccineum]
MWAPRAGRQSLLLGGTLSAGRQTLQPGSWVVAGGIFLLNLSFNVIVQVVLVCGSSYFTISSLQLDLRGTFYINRLLHPLNTFTSPEDPESLVGVLGPEDSESSPSLTTLLASNPAESPSPEASSSSIPKNSSDLPPNPRVLFNWRCNYKEHQLNPLCLLSTFRIKRKKVNDRPKRLQDEEVGGGTTSVIVLGMGKGRVGWMHLRQPRDGNLTL